MFGKVLVIIGLVGPFHIPHNTNPPEDVGVEIKGETEEALIRLCLPQTAGGTDKTYYLYHRLNLAQSEKKPVKILYKERQVKDTVTGRNKLCLEELIY
ncbi:MAG: hypothetical protein ABL958_15005 [Bdellovibrionia bacterium]